MCLILFAWQADPVYRLILAANRDEFRARPSAAAAWWTPEHEIFGGRDLQAGGTWMGIHRRGRFAAVTNHRDLYRPPREGQSRGQLVAAVLGSASPLDTLLHDIAPHCAAYAPFNLLAAEEERLYCLAAEHGSGVLQRVTPGIHGLSNARLDSPWAKVTDGCERLAAVLAADRHARSVPSGRPQPGGAAPAGAAPARQARDGIALQEGLLEALFGLLDQRAVAADERLPDTGLPLERERALSAAMILGQDYGTRCSSVLLWRHDGSWLLQERSLDASARLTGTVTGRSSDQDQGSR